MNSCQICGADTRNTLRFRGALECNDCRAYREYYDSLSPEELRAEHEAMALYVQESENW